MRSLASTYPIILALVALQAGVSWSLSDQRLCADPNCKEIISLAKATVSYRAPDVGLVSFKINSQIRVKSKSAGKDPSLWGIEVNGREGYAPKQFIQEQKILIPEKNLKHLVPVLEPKSSEKLLKTVPKTKLNPSEVSNDAKAEEPETLANVITTPLSAENVATPAALLNASEGEIEATTAPLTEPIHSDVVYKSLKDMATPVLHGIEIIDGTAIPSLSNEEKVVENAVNQQDSIMKNEVIDNKNPNNEKLIETKAENDGENADAVVSKVEQPIEMNENAQNIPPLVAKAEQVKKDAEIEKEVSVENKNQIAEKIDNQNKAEQENDSKKLKQNDNTNFEETEKLTVKAHGALKGKSTTEPAQQKMLLDAYEDDEDAFDDDDVDDEMGDDDEDEDDVIDSDVDIDDVAAEKGTVNNVKPTTQSSSAEIKTTMKPPVTESGFETSTNINYWEDLEADHTTTTPVPIKEETERKDAIVKEKPTENSNNLANNQTAENFSTDDTRTSEKLSESTDILEVETVEPIVNDQPTQLPKQSINQSAINAETEQKQETQKLGDEATKPTPIPQHVEQKQETEKLQDEATKPTPIPQHVEQKQETEKLQDEATKPTPIPQHVEQKQETEKLEDEATKPTPKPQHVEQKQETEKLPDEASKPTPIPQHVEQKQETQKLQDEASKPTPISQLVEQKQETQRLEDEATKPTPIPLHADDIKQEDEVKTESPQVPATPTTLPNFQPTINIKSEYLSTKQVMPSPEPLYDPYQHVHQQQQHSSEQFNYENPNDYYRNQLEKTQSNEHKPESLEPLTTIEIPCTTEADPSPSNSVPTLDYNTVTTSPSPLPVEDTPEPIHNPIPYQMPTEEKRDAGLFATILGTVNTFVNKLGKGDSQSVKTDGNDVDDELQRILYPEKFEAQTGVQEDGDAFCEKLSPNHCPQSKQAGSAAANFVSSQQCTYDWSHINVDNFAEVFVAKAFEMRELLSCLTIVASSVLLFLFGYYCFCNSSREGALISKLNLLERSLLASHKENAILKDDLQKTRSKLTSIEDNSFGSNDMVIALKKELELSAVEKLQLEQKTHNLEKELETAAEAGLELNKIVAELLNNQSGQESMIMNSVEDLQMQFNEQQKTILEINANLAEKSRENSELQLMLAEQNVRLNGEIASLQQDNDELEAEKSALQTRLDEIKTEFEMDISKALEGKNAEIKRLQNDYIDMNNRFEDIHTKWQTGLAKIEALEECMKTLKKDPKINVSDLINVANVRAEILDLQKQRSTLKNRLDTEIEARQHAEVGLQNNITEIDKLKQDFHQSEKDKLEAQTRLEVLSNYFKEKETQLQKELSLKEAIWLKQQGENTSTVDRLTAMQDEIQSLKSQNDALRAEIEAQLAAHKAQIGTLENRAHETWLAARQSERRFEDARAEAAALRRRLTELAGVSANNGDGNRNNVDGKLSAVDFNNAPSPILPLPSLIDGNAGSPLLGTLPPPPHQFLPFMGPPPPPFMNLPPPPFLQSVEMRPAPLGRMMSPTIGRYSPPPPPPLPNERERKRRDDDEYYERRDYEDDYEDDDDYDIEEDDYDYDDDEEQDDRTRHRRPLPRSGGNGSDSEWHRERYSPPPPDRSYRSHSPTDSRYNYDDETDMSPPPSPPGRRGRDGGGGGGSRTGSYHTYSPRPPPVTTSTSTSQNVVHHDRTSKKGNPTSDSDKSHNSAQRSKKGKLMV